MRLGRPWLLGLRRSGRRLLRLLGRRDLLGHVRQGLQETFVFFPSDEATFDVAFDDTQVEKTHILDFFVATHGVKWLAKTAGQVKGPQQTGWRGADRAHRHQKTASGQKLVNCIEVAVDALRTSAQGLPYSTTDVPPSPKSQPF